MKNIKVLGTGCANCKVVHAGGVPGRDKIAGWFHHG